MLSTYNFSVVLTLQRNPIGVRVSIEPCELFLWYQGIWVCDLFWNWKFSLQCYRHLLIENFFEAWSCYRYNCRSNFHKSNEFMQKNDLTRSLLQIPGFWFIHVFFYHHWLYQQNTKTCDMFIWLLNYVYVQMKWMIMKLTVMKPSVNMLCILFFSFSLHWYLLLFIPG